MAHLTIIYQNCAWDGFTFRSGVFYSSHTLYSSMRKNKNRNFSVLCVVKLFNFRFNSVKFHIEPARNDQQLYHMKLSKNVQWTWVHRTWKNTVQQNHFSWAGIIEKLNTLLPIGHLQMSTMTMLLCRLIPKFSTMLISIQYQSSRMLIVNGRFSSIAFEMACMSHPLLQYSLFHPRSLDRSRSLNV